MEKRLAELEAKLTEGSAVAARLQKLRDCDWESFSQALPEGTAFISYILTWDMANERGMATEQRYLALVVKKGSPPILLDIGDATSWDTFVGFLGDFMHLLRNAPDLIESQGEQEAETKLCEKARRVWDSALRFAASGKWDIMS